MKIIFNLNANNFHLKYMNYDLKQYSLKCKSNNFEIHDSKIIFN